MGTIDRRRRYDLRHGRDVVARQQSKSSAKRFVRDFATEEDLLELLSCYGGLLSSSFFEKLGKLKREKVIVFGEED